MKAVRNTVSNEREKSKESMQKELKGLMDERDVRRSSIRDCFNRSSAERTGKDGLCSQTGC
eukprot:3282766-Amphidinium_carterae.1